jgi:hypothetical protein
MKYWAGKGEGMNDDKELTLTFTHEQAWSYATYLNRVKRLDYRVLADDADETTLMHEAGEVVRQALAAAGIVSR